MAFRKDQAKFVIEEERQSNIITDIQNVSLSKMRLPRCRSQLRNKGNVGSLCG